jgi:transposase InsO family protein
MVTPAAHREAAAYLQQTYEMSQRRACRVIAGDRASVRYQAKRADDGALRERLKALAWERRRFGYRRLHVLLRREGHAVNKKRVQRLYREERLMVRRRGGRKRGLGTRRPMETPAAAMRLSGRVGAIPARSTFTSVTPALWIATSVLVPVAIPTSASAMAGASFTPSPAMATIFPAPRGFSTGRQEG